MNDTTHKFPYSWTLKDTTFTKDKGKVFSCFACGGGSTMGYKLAGFDVIGCNEIDAKMMQSYVANHHPKYSFLEPIQSFKNRDDLPEELYSLDILDGSPPCSSFSMAGNREKDWGKKKKFREGQVEQILDTLFFDFIDLAKKLQPKVVVAENVEGLLTEQAKPYVIKIYRELQLAGYQVRHFLLDASKMGVPQRRKRVFFIALRNDLIQHVDKWDMFGTIPDLQMVFKESAIKYREIQSDFGPSISDLYKGIWEHRKMGDKDFSCINGRIRNKPNTGFGQNFIYNEKVVGTLTAKSDCMVKFDYPQYLSNEERCKIGSFPSDYNFNKSSNHYLIGMSVPPVMIAQIATRIYDQWLKNIPH